MLLKSLLSVFNVSVVPVVAGLPFLLAYLLLLVPAVAVFLSAVVSPLGFLLARVSAMAVVPIVSSVANVLAVTMFMILLAILLLVSSLLWLEL
jgi:hypothetical protein